VPKLRVHPAWTILRNPRRCWRFDNPYFISSPRMNQSRNAIDWTLSAMCVVRSRKTARTATQKCEHMFWDVLWWHNSLRHYTQQQWWAPTTLSPRTECPASCIRFWPQACGIVVAPSKILRGSFEPGAVSPGTLSQLVPSWYRRFWRHA